MESSKSNNTNNLSEMYVALLALYKSSTRETNNMIPILPLKKVKEDFNSV